MSSQRDLPQWSSNRIDLIVVLFPILLLLSNFVGTLSLSSQQLNSFPSSLSASTASSVSSSPSSSSSAVHNHAITSSITTMSNVNVQDDEVEDSRNNETEATTTSSFTIVSPSQAATSSSYSSSSSNEQPSTPKSSENFDADDDEVDGESSWGKYDYGQLIRVPLQESTGNGSFAEFEWRVPKIVDMIQEDILFVRSPSFHLSKPGYRVQFLLILNNTYADGASYLGLFFRLLTSEYDANLEWPYQLRTTLTLVDLVSANDSIKHTVTPNVDPCRLRSVFLRPSQQDDWTPTPDGCGSRRVIPLHRLISESSRYLRNGTLVVRGLFQLDDKGSTHKVASIHMRYNNLVTKHVWRVNNFTVAFEKATENGSATVLQSEPFYTHQGGYLVKLFMTLLPKDRAFAISLALMQGDYDRYLQWPFPYTLEVSIVDHSPEYWRKDYTISLNPSSADCTSSPFFQPSSYLDFCFTTIQSFHLLNLTHYRFIENDYLDIQLTTKFNHFSGRKQASLGFSQGSLVSEFTWILPNIRYKLSRYDYAGRTLKTFTSPEFYTNGQGYLMQLSLRLNSTGPGKGYIGLQLTLLEGEHDALLQWPFNHTYQLMLINQPNDYSTNEGLINYNRTEIITSAREEDMSVTIRPSDLKSHECSPASFVKPIERNPPCGKKRLIDFSRINRSGETIKFGNMLIKARIFL